MYHSNVIQPLSYIFKPLSTFLAKVKFDGGHAHNFDCNVNRDGLDTYISTKYTTKYINRKLCFLSETHMIMKNKA